MSIYVIADLHLSFCHPKPMDIFGTNWEKHEEKIKNDWISKVKQDDLVVIPGDFSWEMNLEETYEDFKYLDTLPGMKILLKGNHDYWWTTLNKMNNFIKESNFNTIKFLHNNSYSYEKYIIVGTRGWNLFNTTEDEKIYKREVDRLEISIKDGINKYGKNKEIIVFMHYPPITKENLSSISKKNDFINLMNKYSIKRCFYGHIHNSYTDVVEGEIKGVNLKLISADYLDFKLYNI